MLPFEARPDQTPRRVEIERRKRIFAENNIADLLTKEGVQIAQDGSVTITLAGESKSFQPYLPLEWFDDESYEERSVQSWIAGDQNTIVDYANKIFAIPCKASIRGAWYGGYAIAYDDERKLWKFKWAKTEEAKVSEMNETWLPRYAKD
jgi:dynein heavy chain